MAVEFRNKTWLDEKYAPATHELERELGVAHVVVDSPPVETANVVPAVWDISSTCMAILRLHGRNHATWNVKGATSASDRINYDYTEQELVTFIPDIRALERWVGCCRSSSTTTRRTRASGTP